MEEEVGDCLLSCKYGEKVSIKMKNRQRVIGIAFRQLNIQTLGTCI